MNWTAPFSREAQVSIVSHQSVLEADHEALERLVRFTMSCQGRERGSVSVVLVDNAALREVNRRHLGHDWDTDIVTFDLAEDWEREENQLSGELVISVEMAVAMASSLGSTPMGELGLYVVHGLLHLCDYDDHDEDDIQRMRIRERQVLEQAQWDWPYSPVEREPAAS